MISISSNLNIMIKAAEKASKSAIRDFGEVEKLQVSKKGPRDFVTKTDKHVEKILIEELSKTKKNYSFLSEEVGSIENKELLNTFQEMKKNQVDIPMIINGKEVKTSKKIEIRAPHNHKLKLGTFNEGDESHVKMAIDAALKAKKEWGSMSWQSRASIFLKAAELIAGSYRSKINGSTMLGQSKNVFHLCNHLARKS